MAALRAELHRTKALLAEIRRSERIIRPRRSV
jgi:hypothetical protein